MALGPLGANSGSSPTRSEDEVIGPRDLLPFDRPAHICIISAERLLKACSAKLRACIRLSAAFEFMVDSSRSVWQVPEVQLSSLR